MAPALVKRDASGSRLTDDGRAGYFTCIFWALDEYPYCWKFRGSQSYRECEYVLAAGQGAEAWMEKTSTWRVDSYQSFGEVCCYAGRERRSRLQQACKHGFFEDYLIDHLRLPRRDFTHWDHSAPIGVNWELPVGEPWDIDQVGWVACPPGLHASNSSWAYSPVEGHGKSCRGRWFSSISLCFTRRMGPRRG